PEGAGPWASAVSLTGDIAASQLALNCAPVMNNDERSLYVATAYSGELAQGYLVAVNAMTLAPQRAVALNDPRGGPAVITTNSTASPMVGPDGDVYFGVLEDPCCQSPRDR